MKYKIFTCISGAILLMVVALYYGYPLVTSDTNSYILCGFAFTMPADRSPFYGFFLRHSSLWTSLWYTVFAQSLLLSFLLIRYIRSFYSTDPGMRLVLINLLVIVSCTYVSWVASFLMPDVFGGILLVALLLYLCEQNIPRLYRFLYLLIIAFSVITHNSHTLILGLFSGLVLLMSLLKKHRQLIIKSLSLLSVSIAAFFFMCMMNKKTSGVFTFSRGGHAFVMAKLTETGVLQQYLDANCDKKHYAICNYRYDLHLTSMGFLWDMDAPLYKTGGWENSAPENNAIIKDIFTTPKYCFMFFRKSLTATLRQLTKLQQSQPEARQGEFVYATIDKYYKDELIEFRDGGQFLWNEEPRAYNKLYLLALVLSTITVLIIYSRLPDKRSILLLYAFLACFIICNAFITATFGSILDRLNIKVFWLLPATNIIVLIRYLSEKWRFRPEINKI